MEISTLLTQREKLLLQNMYKTECKDGIDELIKACEEKSKTQPMLELNENTLKEIEQYKRKYINTVKEMCNNLTKVQMPTLDIILGLPGSGKSKIIKISERMQNAFKCDADKIKADLAQILNCNINSPAMHEISTTIRDAALEIASSLGCDIVIEKVGKNIDSIFSTLEAVNKHGSQYNCNLYLIHCSNSISRLRNALRFQKYNNEESGISARMIPDDSIKSFGAKPTETFFEIVKNQKLRNKFGICEAFIQESIFEENKKSELVTLYNENLNLDEKFMTVQENLRNLLNALSEKFEKNYSDEKIQIFKSVLLKHLYSTKKDKEIETLLKVENGDEVALLEFIKNSLTDKNIHDEIEKAYKLKRSST